MPVQKRSQKNMATTIRSPLNQFIMIRSVQMSSGATRRKLPSETGTRDPCRRHSKRLPTDTRATSILGSYSIQLIRFFALNLNTQMGDVLRL